MEQESGMSATELVLFIGFLVMIGFAWWINDSWARECSKMNREWYDFYRFIELCWDDSADESGGSDNDHQ